MRGLLIKDLFVLKKSLKFFLLIVILWSMLPGFYSHGFAAMFGALLPITAIAYDERSKWNTLAATMPYSPLDIVLEKYVLGYILSAAVFVLSIASDFVFGLVFPNDVPESKGIAALIIPMCTALLMLAVILPIVFRLGTEKSRLVFYLLVGAVTAMMGLLFSSVTEIPGDEFANFSGAKLTLIIIFAATAANIISIPVSVRIYKKKR